MNKYFKVMYASAKMSLMREMEYRADFVMFFLQTATFVFFNLLFYKVILGNINSMGDWNYPDMVVLFGTYTIIDSIFMTFVLTNVSRIESYVRKGTLDSFLVKPLDSQFLISTQNVNLPQLPAIVFGVAIVCYGFRIGHYNIPTLNVLLYLLFILSSAVIIYAMTVVLNCVIFVIDKARRTY